MSDPTHRDVLPFQGLLYDMDGTLVDTEPMWHHAERELMAGYGLGWSEADQRHCLGGSTERVCRYMAGLIEASGQEPPDWTEIAAAFQVSMLNQLAADPPQPQPGVAALLQEIRDVGIPTALVSSSPRPLMDAVLAAIGDEWFDVTISSNDVDRFKPDPFPYLKAAGILGVDPAWCLAIEDSPTGVASAAAAGAYVVAVEHLAVIAPAPRQTVVTTLSGVGAEQLAAFFEAPAAVSGSGLDPSRS